MRLLSISEYVISRRKRALVGSTGSLGSSVDDSVVAATPLALLLPELFLDFAFERLALLLLPELALADAVGATASVLGAASLD